MITFGKKVGPHLYFHKSLIDSVDEQLYRKLSSYDKLFTVNKWGEEYNLIKVNLLNGDVSFILSKDFDISDEPMVDKVYLIRNGRLVKILNYETRELSKRQIYHHKWTMVKPDYKGFDVEQSKERSTWWLNHPKVFERKDKDKTFSSKIGSYGYWENLMKELKEYDGKY